MPFTILFSENNFYSGNNVWIQDGNREICLNYKYYPMSGSLKYAAVVHRISETDGPLDDYGIEQHENTAMRRFTIRPVDIVVETDLADDALMDTIRYQMCHGAGCKGPRSKIDDTYSDTNSDTVSMLSDEDFQVSPETHKLKTIRKLKYYLAGDEPRHIFIALKGRSSNGDVLYGASIMRVKEDPNYIPSNTESKEHFKTAVSRLEKCPVHTKVSDEFKHQLKSNSRHREDITAEIVDEIFVRREGKLKIRGTRV